MRLIILINYRNVYCWYKMFYNYFKILFPPFMKKSICYGYGLVFWTDKHTVHQVCVGVKRTKAFESKQVLHTSPLELPFIEITYLRAGSHSIRTHQTGWILDDDRVTDRKRSCHLLLCDVWHRMWNFCKETRKKETMVTLCPYDIYRDPKI